jgi:hypothetical protein
MALREPLWSIAHIMKIPSVVEICCKPLILPMPGLDILFNSKIDLPIIRIYLFNFCIASLDGVDEVRIPLSVA